MPALAAASANALLPNPMHGPMHPATIHAIAPQTDSMWSLWESVQYTLASAALVPPPCRLTADLTDVLGCATAIPFLPGTAQAQISSLPR